MNIETSRSRILNVGQKAFGIIVNIIRRNVISIDSLQEIASIVVGSELSDFATGHGDRREQTNVVVGIGGRIIVAVLKRLHAIERVISISDWFGAATYGQTLTFESVRARNLSHLGVVFIVKRNTRQRPTDVKIGVYRVTMAGSRLPSSRISRRVRLADEVVTEVGFVAERIRDRRDSP